jgi:hypothetical protein
MKARAFFSTFTLLLILLGQQVKAQTPPGFTDVKWDDYTLRIVSATGDVLQIFAGTGPIAAGVLPIAILVPPHQVRLLSGGDATTVQKSLDDYFAAQARGGGVPTKPPTSTATGDVPITAIMFDDVAGSVAVPRPEGITVTFIGEDTKITRFHGSAFILRHQKGTSKRFLEGTLLSNTRSGGSLSGGGIEFLREGGGLIYDSGMGTAGNLQESKQVLIAKQLSQVAVDAVADVRKMPGHESFTPPGYSSLQEISKYRLRSDGSR